MCRTSLVFLKQSAAGAVLSAVKHDFAAREREDKSQKCMVCTLDSVMADMISSGQSHSAARRSMPVAVVLCLDDRSARRISAVEQKAICKPAYLDNRLDMKFALAS